MAVRLNGDPRFVESEEVGRRVAVPIQGDVDDDWRDAFAEVFQSQVAGSQYSGRDAYRERMKVEGDQISFAISASNARALPRMLDTVKTSVSIANGRARELAEQRKAATDAAGRKAGEAEAELERQLQDWAKANPPD